MTQNIDRAKLICFVSNLDQQFTYNNSFVRRQWALFIRIISDTLFHKVMVLLQDPGENSITPIVLQ